MNIFPSCLFLFPSVTNLLTAILNITRKCEPPGAISTLIGVPIVLTERLDKKVYTVNKCKKL